MCYNWRPGDERTGPNFYYTMPPANLSRVFAKIKKEIIFPEMLDILLPMWYYNSVRRARLVNSQSGRCFSSRKFLEKSLKNLLTNRLKYGILKVQKARERQSQTGKPTRASKTDSPRPDRTVSLCAEYKCEPDHAG